MKEFFDGFTKDFGHYLIWMTTGEIRDAGGIWRILGLIVAISLFAVWALTPILVQILELLNLQP